ncbi:TetR family transcriptional regulator C-terminal domain-containing protein [Nocardiopsis sp. HNM0947]|uniref:TetR family transcriptional regulator C-terminal domain-containing protein n=1 Tax=Nocardiopsis coralli TaxID=2772213 RepID=A0ABR9P302_9ACTN|nr:TetR/AcrR family transcriptional regulator [Nocardiopsis coralli]MBE2998214.1 TetR family transcriptional regulator C-terminal domain-containing protein [Nocardiopsis coralli]
MNGEATDDVRDRARAAIHRSGISQREFADRLGIDPTKLSKSLTGRRRFTPEELAAIALEAGVTVNWLLNGDDDAVTVAAAPRDTAVAAPPAGPADRPLAVKEHNRRLQIIEAAWTLIAERGFHSVRVAQVARACGTSSATVHYHFPTLNHLLEEALRHSVKQAFDRQVAGLHEIEDAHERLLSLIELQLPASERLQLEWSIWMQVWTSAALDPEMREIHAHSYRRWHETIARTLTEGIDTGVFADHGAEEMTKRLTALIDGMGIQVMTGMPGRSVGHMRRTLHELIERDFLKRD